jgi:hypothetical protein
MATTTLYTSPHPIIIFSALFFPDWRAFFTG